MAVPGSIVAFRQDGALALGVVAGEEKQRVRVIVPGGREERITEGRIVFEVERSGRVPGAGPDDRKAAGRRAEAAESHVVALAERVDVPLLWDLVVGSGGTLDDAELADLAIGDRSGAARAALFRALSAEGARFQRRGDVWEARAPEALHEILTQRERVARRDEDRRRALEALAEAARGGRFAPSDNPEERRFLEALEETAILGPDASEASRGAAEQALLAAGVRHDRSREGAFLLLRRAGRFSSDDENLEVLRYRMRTEFPREVVESARAAVSRGFSRDGRSDLTGLDVVSIDAPQTREIDDALSIEPRPGGGVRLGVHVADPAAYVEKDDPVDREAFARAATRYFPESRLPMIPEAISEGAASLAEGEDRPALSFLVALDADGEISSHEVVRSVVRSVARLTYEAADAAIGREGGPHAALLRSLERAAALLEGRRAAAGAVRIPAPEVEPRVLDDGRIALVRIDPDSPSRRLVSEAMVLAGAVAARFCAGRSVPAIYRRQPPPDRPLAAAAASSEDFAAARALRRSLRRGEVGVSPGPHFALGLPAYAQATSPLRRFQDLVTHRQIVAALAGLPPPYDLESLRRIAATTEAAEADGRRAERAADRYWLLRYLEGSVGAEVDAVVVEVEPRPVVVLVETLLEEPLAGLAGVRPGDRIRLRIERVNPRADRIALRPVPGA